MKIFLLTTKKNSVKIYNWKIWYLVLFTMHNKVFAKFKIFWNINLFCSMGKNPIYQFIIVTHSQKIDIIKNRATINMCENLLQYTKLK